MKRLSPLVAAVLLAAGLTGCSSESTDGGEETLTVFAAASLTTTFTELGKAFEAEHDGVRVTFNFAGSSDLVAQIQQGAPADVFASADSANMDAAVGDDLVEGDPVDFATNTLQIATPPDNPADITSLQDLAKKGVKVVVCAPPVPCGAATVKVTEAAGVKLRPVSEEQSVSGVLGKVTSGEADAGLVYVTDVIAAGDAVHGVAFPESSAAVNTNEIAVLSDAQDLDLAQEFLDLVVSDQGQSVLAEAGFGTP